MRFHVLGLPHTEISGAYEFCAYTQKLRRFAPMMEAMGHEVILYGGTSTDVECTEHVEVVSEANRERWFGHYNWKTDVFDGFGPAEWWDVTNQKIIPEIRARLQPEDIICLVAGIRQKSLIEAFPGHIVCEPFVGYSGITSAYCAFESYAWMHYVYGDAGWEGRMFDAVIPNYFDPSQFDPTLQREDYLLFVGRLNESKGPHIAAEVAEKLGMRLVVAGQGNPAIAPGCDYAGVLDASARKMLMGRARALLMPTLYVEPFGGVAIEAMLSGTPVITHDFGAMTETISHGHTGFRCRTLGDWLSAVDQIDTLWGPDRIAAHARDRYGMLEVGRQFDKWFQRLQIVQTGEGWYDQSRSSLDNRYGARR